MRKVIVIAAAALICAAVSLFQSQPSCASGRCMSVQPICNPGQRAICVCESDISLKCNWICGSTR